MYVKSSHNMSVIAKPPTLDPLEFFLDESNESLAFDRVTHDNPASSLLDSTPASEQPGPIQFTNLNPKKYLMNREMDPNDRFVDLLFPHKNLNSPERKKCDILVRRKYPGDLRLERPKSPPHFPVLVHGIDSTLQNKYGWHSDASKHEKIQLQVRKLESNGTTNFNISPNHSTQNDQVEANKKIIVEGSPNNLEATSRTSYFDGFLNWMQLKLDFDEKETEFFDSELLAYGQNANNSAQAEPEPDQDEQSHAVSSSDLELESKIATGTYDDMKTLIFDEDLGETYIGNARPGYGAV